MDCAAMSCQAGCDSYYDLCISTEGCYWDSDDSICNSADGWNWPNCCISGYSTTASASETTTSSASETTTSSPSETTTSSPSETTTTSSPETTMDCAAMSCQAGCDSYYDLCISTDGCYWDSDDSICNSADGLNSGDCCLPGYSTTASASETTTYSASETTTSSTTTAPPFETIVTTSPPVVVVSEDASETTTSSASETTYSSSTTFEPSGAPTTIPTVAPTFTVCDSNDSLNIAFLMDESGSVDSDEWDVIVSFVDRIAA